MVVLGRIEGDIDSSQLEIRSGATLLGDIYYDVIEIHQGSSINGRMVRREGADPKAAATTSPTESTTGSAPTPG